MALNPNLPPSRERLQTPELIQNFEDPNHVFERPNNFYQDGMKLNANYLHDQQTSSDPTTSLSSIRGSESFLVVIGFNLPH